MYELPISATPYQEFLVTLDDQNCVITLCQRGDRLYFDLEADGVVVRKGAVCLPTVPLLQCSTTFRGNFYMIDELSKPALQAAMQWRELGTRYKLIYVLEDEAAFIADEKWAHALAEVAHA